jgi:hypothetical protein
MLLGDVELSGFVSLRSFVQFIFRADLIGQRTSRSGGDKQTQNRYRADPGPGESHSVNSVNMKMNARGLVTG